VPRPIVEWRQAGSPLASWQTAVAAAGSYDSELLNGFRVERAELRAVSASLEGLGVLGLAALYLGGDISVTDFGGAAGDIGRDFLAAFPRAKYTVVENPTLVGLVRPGAVCFTTDIPSTCDLFFSSCALPYIADQAAVLQAAFASATRAVVLVRNCFSERKLCRVQRSWLFNNGNGPIPPGYKNVRISYPHQTIREGDVFDTARKHGFRCVSKLEEYSGVVPYRGLVYGRQLVFLRD